MESQPQSKRVIPAMTPEEYDKLYKTPDRNERLLLEKRMLIEAVRKRALPFINFNTSQMLTANIIEFSVPVNDPGSPYHTYIIPGEIKIPLDYPRQSPQVKFKAGFCHINVDAIGEHCGKSFNDTWDPKFNSCRDSLLLIKIIIGLPNYESPNPPSPLYQSMVFREQDYKAKTLNNWLIFGKYYNDDAIKQQVDAVIIKSLEKNGFHKLQL